MEKNIFHGIAMGGKLYSLRMAKRMTQEQLAAQLCVSPAAVSKWERNQAVPSVEMLWAMADFFDCSMDELAGRRLAQVERMGVYDERQFRLIMVGEDLLRCAEISREKGLPVMEEAVMGLNSGSRFLRFAVPYIMNVFMGEAGSVDFAFGLLENYAGALPEGEQREGRMVAAALKAIFAGKGRKILQEIIASYIGMEYRERDGKMNEILKYTRQELIQKFRDKEMYSEATNLIEGCAQLGDFEIQAILRNLEYDTLKTALAGASGVVVERFFSNLADRIMYLVSEDLERWQGTEEEILEAQRKVLEVGSFCLDRHGDLVEQDGKYRELWNAQAKHYT